MIHTANRLAETLGLRRPAPAPEIELLRLLIDPARTALDIGAGEGIYARDMLPLAKRTIAFEPNPQSAHRLRKALPKLEVIEAAVSPEDGVGTLWAHVVSSDEAGCASLRHFPIKLVKLTPTLVGRVGFMKIDEDGHELAVLKGARDIIAADKPNVIIKVGDECRASSLSDVLAFFDAYGYRALTLSGSRLTRLADGPRSNGNIVFM